ncbi:MAG: DUF3152 domain-containing protein, partial [Rhizobiales bacterium]|nr:DUF3152 domain-containing protein [Hyphomicrobiales bacterium]
MSRMIGAVGCLLALMISLMTAALASGTPDGMPHAIEGIAVQRPTDGDFVGNSVDGAAATNGLIAERWNCAEPPGIVRVRRVTLCRVPPQNAETPALVEPSDKPGTSGGTPTGTPGVIRYRVLVEQGLDHLARSFAARVSLILGLDTGWARNAIRFVQVAGQHDFTVLLARPKSVDRLCRPLRTRGRLSCAIYRGAVINAKRWLEGAQTWGADVKGYHHYLVNHEVGHVLGLRHLKCPAAGAPAPIMLQQTIFLKGCTANGVATPSDVASLERVM